MNFTRFQGCCGATELHGIPTDEKEITKELKNIATGVRERNSHRAGGLHLVIATVNEIQELQIKALKKAGFECIYEWENGITGRNVLLFVAEVKISHG